METITKIRRLRLVKGQSISAIARDLNLSRNTVKKYLNTTDLPSYQRQRQPRPQLGQWQQRLSDWLTADHHLPKRQRRTARRLFECLQAEGYTGAYDSVQRFVRDWKNSDGPRPQQAFVPLAFAPGDACQFDWSLEHVVLGGVSQAIKLAHFRLAYSRQMFLVAYPRETREMVLDAHVRAFDFFGGVPQRMVYDNLKTVVDSVLSGKARQFNRHFLALANHYLFEPVACTPAAGWEKGQVENQVGNVREWLFTPTPRFADLAALNAWLAERCRVLAARPHPSGEGTIGDWFGREQPQLQPVQQPFDGYTEQLQRVSSTCLVSIDRNRYSVPAEHAGQVVAVRVRADSLSVVVNGKEVAHHARCFGRNQLCCQLWHYVPLLAHKPGALRDGVPFTPEQLPPAFARLHAQVIKQPQGDRQLAELLLAARPHGVDALEVACELAAEQGSLSVAVALNALHRLTAPPRPEQLAIDQLALVVEPAANCARYDSLRQVHHG